MKGLKCEIESVTEYFSPLVLLQVAQIYSACDNPNVKHALFSATLGSGVEEFCHAYFTTPIRIIVGLK